jgi:hypothetical protein
MMMFDKGDPYIKLSCGQWEGRTTTRWEAGPEVTWDFAGTGAGAGAGANSSGGSGLVEEQKLRYVTTLGALRNGGRMNIIAMDDNKMNADKLIGQGEFLFSEVNGGDKLTVAGLKSSGNILLLSHSVALKDEKGKTGAGDVTVKLRVREKLKEAQSVTQAQAQAQALQSTTEGKVESKTPTPDSTEVEVLVAEIAASKLRNVEMMMFDKNDPYAMLTFGSTWEGRTKTIAEAGSEVTWQYGGTAKSDSEEMTYTTTLGALKAGRLGITMMDENKMNAHKRIGGGEVIIAEAKNADQLTWLQSQGGVLILEHTVPLKDDTGKEGAGFVTVKLRVREKPPPTAATELKKDAKGNVIAADPTIDQMEIEVLVHEIIASKLKNVEMMMFDKNDPYVKLAFGDSWEAKTVEKSGAGSDAAWKYEEGSGEEDAMRFYTTVGGLKVGGMRVEAMDKNSMSSDAFIGRGELVFPEASGFPLIATGALQTAGTVAQLEHTVALKNEKGKPGTGFITLKLSVRKRQPRAKFDKSAVVKKELTEANKEDALEVTVFVTDITASKLKNVETMLFDNDDPYVKLSFAGGWEARTTTKWEGGSDVAWNYGDTGGDEARAMQFTTTLGELKSGRIVAVAMDANKMTEEKLIGKGEAVIADAQGAAAALMAEALKSQGVVILQSTVELADAKGKPGAGTLALKFEVSLKVNSEPFWFL